MCSYCCAQHQTETKIPVIFHWRLAAEDVQATSSAGSLTRVLAAAIVLVLLDLANACDARSSLPSSGRSLLVPRVSVCRSYARLSTHVTLSWQPHKLRLLTCLHAHSRNWQPQPSLPPCASAGVNTSSLEASLGKASIITMCSPPLLIPVVHLC